MQQIGKICKENKQKKWINWGLLFTDLFLFIATGVPAPRVTWSRGGRLIDETFHVLANGTVRNEISFHAVDRSGINSIQSLVTYTTI